jgi:hypothetical protein
MLRVDSPARLRSAASDASVVFELVDAVPGTVVDELARRPEVRSVAIDGHRLTVALRMIATDVPPLVRWLAATGTPIAAVRPVQPSLESIYFDVMGLRPYTNGALS